MVRIEQLAKTALAGDALTLRSEVQDWLCENARIAAVSAPSSDDPSVLCVSAALVELLAERRGEPPPVWSAEIGPVKVPIYLVRAAAHMRRLRRLCETESPLPLRKRNLFAPPTYLQSA